MTTGRRIAKHTYIGIVLSVLLLVAFPAINYLFGTFYSADYEQYKIWFPRLYFVVFPIVKTLPFIVLAVIVFLLRQIFGIVPLFFRHFRKIFSKYFLSVSISLASLLMVLLIAEGVVRWTGVTPGFRMYTRFFHPADSLYLFTGFYADSNGIFCISQEAAAYIREELRTKNSKQELTPLSKYQTTEIYPLAEDFLLLRNPKYHSQFKTFLQQINTLQDTADIGFFNAIKDYVASPINSNGFKSIEFKKYNPKRKSILLLGDSFTWGHSTSNKTNCFADLLLTMGYVVYNSGITGTDPAQYLQVAKALVPQLEPDFVVVNFYMGNDIMYFERDPKPYTPVFFCTNAGNLLTCPDGIYFNNAQEAYDYALANFTIPTEWNRFNKLCSKTALGTLVWRALFKAGYADTRLPQYQEHTLRADKLRTKKPYSDVQIRQIKEIAEQHGGKFLLIAIPMLDGGRFIYPESDPNLFEKLDYFVPPVEKKHYYQFTDGHFNDLGSEMYAAFIDSLVRTSK